jgi:hypothetical protein
MHLEIVPNPTPEAFITTVKALIVKRELINYLCSDKDCNFVGASTELKALFKSEAFLGRRTTVTRAQFQWNLFLRIHPKLED